MKIRYSLPLVVSILLTFLLVGCGGLQTAPTQEATVDTNALRTEVAQTIEAQYTLDAALTLAAEPTATVEIATPTEVASFTPVVATYTPVTVVLEPTPTKVVNVVYPTYTPTYYPDRAELVSMTPVLGKTFKPGADFDLTFTLKNIGDLKWTTGYRLEHLSGVKASDQSGNTYTIMYLPSGVATGKSIDVSLDMVAPSTPGHYTSTWALVNTDSTNFYILSYGFDVKN